MSYGYIYRTTNTANSTIYIGQHVGEFNPLYLGSGNLIRLAVKKYGISAFRVESIEVCDAREQLDEAEIKWIKSHRDCKHRMYNIASGGLGHSGPFTEEHLKNLRLSARSEEKRKMMSDRFKGRIVSAEWAAAISRGKMGKKLSEEVKAHRRLVMPSREPPSMETKMKLKETWRRRREAFEIAKKDNPSLTIHDFRATNRRGEKNI